MKHDIKKFSDALVANAGLMAPLLLAAAVVTTIYSAQAVRGAITGFLNVSEDVRSKSEVKVESKPITVEQATAAARMVGKQAPAIRISMRDGAVVLSAGQKEQFAELVHAAGLIQNAAPDVSWEATDICLNSCDSGIAAQMKIVGYKNFIRAGQ